MKRGIITLALLILLATPLILAQENITGPAQEQLSALRGGLDIKTENVLEKEVNFPQALETPMNVIFGIKEGATWQQLIVTLGVFIGFFILIFSVAGLIPFLGEGVLKVIASLIITALASMTGTLNAVAMFFFDIAGLFKWTTSWGPLKMIIAILIAAIIIIAANWYVHKVKIKMKLKSAKQIGRDMWAVAKLNKKKVKQELNQ